MLVDVLVGCPLRQQPLPRPKFCGTADIFGDHQVGCVGTGDRISQYNSIRDVFSVAQSAALAHLKGISGLVPGSLSHPADVFLPNWSCWRPAALDIHVISPLQQLTLSEASVTLSPAHPCA